METLKKKIIEYTDSLLKEDAYKGILVNIDIQENKEEGAIGLSYKSNESFGVKNSYKLSNAIREFSLNEYGNRTDIAPLFMNVSFVKNMGNTTKKTDNNDKGNSKIVFNVEKPKYKLEDVVLPQSTLDEIKNALSLIENFDMIYNIWGWSEKEPAAKTIMCFYGKPGTGKTMCAHGIADYLCRNILIASYADIQSEYVGVGPKNLKAIFEQAEKENAVLFFDEADSFLRKRTSDTSSSASMHYNSMTNEMMKHLEDFNGLVIFATNLTENTDEAFKTRITCSIEFTMPDEEARKKIIRYMTPSKLPLATEFSEEDYTSIAKVCDGFSGRDVRNAVKHVITEGARNKTYPFTCESFLKGFENYREMKDKLSDDINGGKNDNINPIDLYTENGCILSLVTYAAWFDGTETEEETVELKEKAKLLGRNKLIIGKLSDLSSLEEICEGIKHQQTKKKAIEYLADVLSVSDKDEENVSFIKNAANLLNIKDDAISSAIDYYNSVKTKREISSKLEESINSESCPNPEP